MLLQTYYESCETSSCTCSDECCYIPLQLLIPSDKTPVLDNCRRNVYDLFPVKYQETRKVSLLQYQTAGSLLKNDFNVFWDRIVSIYITYCMFWNKVFKEKIEMELGLIYRLYCFNFDTDMLFFNVKYKESVLQYQNTSWLCFSFVFSS